MDYQVTLSVTSIRMPMFNVVRNTGRCSYLRWEKIRQFNNRNWIRREACEYYPSRHFRSIMVWNLWQWCFSIRWQIPTLSQRGGFINLTKEDGLPDNQINDISILWPTLSNQARRKTDLSPRILSTAGLMKITELMALSRASFLSSPFSRRRSETHVLSESEVNGKYAFAPCSMSVWCYSKHLYFIISCKTENCKKISVNRHWATTNV